MCCLDLLCCCLGPAACGLCCGSCGRKAHRSILTRFLYLTFLVGVVLVSAVLLAPDVQKALEEDAVSQPTFSFLYKCHIHPWISESFVCEREPLCGSAFERGRVSNGEDLPGCPVGLQSIYRLPRCLPSVHGCGIVFCPHDVINAVRFQ